ncbi:SpaH/EbpB family LPXTG-anchored major pilin [Tessaracoccus caeni]|uniref:SpaH/EbpB family LPXTG-anchored major pilin n=1 Tax=Tessaracoccus caeni TaxID=3031239 RepID=UPI0023DC7EDB|nr:SpaH/EbpB family LPXTG-anchored major pilin [Tessaracoccus caeni]MDF1487467.1 SpaH/EbpB family LPXTG-anchored major pilin [Tessaracoccus caeni]
MKINTKKRGLLASVGALVAAAALTLGGVGTAHADPTIHLPAFATANLHITKYDTPPAGPNEAANGLPTSHGDGPSIPAGAVPLEDVTFSVRRVSDIDLSTNPGWEQAGEAQLNIADPFNPVVETSQADDTALDLDAAVSLTTDVNGVVDFANLPIGLYLVQETFTPAGVTPSAPFLVTLPLTDPSNQSDWLTDIYVYPKNSKLGEPEKAIDDATPFTAIDQQRLSYTITADVPRNPGQTDGTFRAPTGFRVSDDLAAELTPVSVVAELAPVAAGTLTSGTDYTVTPATFAAGDEVVVTFTAAGLEKLRIAAATPASKVVVTIVADVSPAIATADAAALAVLGNVGRVFPDQASIDAPPADARWLVTNNVDTHWGTLRFTKADQEGNPLQNAQFKVATSRNNADTGVFIRAAAVMSAADGAVEITGLRASDFANNAMQELGAETTPGGGFDTYNPDYVVYWLTETTAPEGYELLAQPVPVALLSDGEVRQISQNSDGSLRFDAATGRAEYGNPGDDLEIINVAKNGGFTLPLTGGTGTLMLTVGGIALLGLVLVVARRRRSQA